MASSIAARWQSTGSSRPVVVAASMPSAAAVVVGREGRSMAVAEAVAVVVVVAYTAATGLHRRTAELSTGQRQSTADSAAATAELFVAARAPVLIEGRTRASQTQLAYGKRANLAFRGRGLPCAPRLHPGSAYRRPILVCRGRPGGLGPSS